MSKNEDLKRWEEIDEIIRKMNVALYGFDISKLSFKEQRFVEEQAKKRWELEAERERRNPKPKPILSKAEELEERRLAMLWAKSEKIANGRPVKELSNDDLEKQLEVLRVMVK